MTNEEIENILRQPIISWEQNKIISSNKAKDFVFNYLIQKGGKGKVYRLLLEQNELEPYLNSFLSDIEFFTENNLINILKSNSRFIKLELTLSGQMFYKDKTKTEVKIPSYLFRVNVYIIGLLKNIWNFIYVTINKYLLKFFKSGYWILFAAIFAFFYFYLPYKESINSQNNKPNALPIKEELPMKKSSKGNLELLVSSKDSVISKDDTLKVIKKK
jgi:hypothetical protein